MNTDPKKSAQPCGCDEGATYACSDYPDCYYGKYLKSFYGSLTPTQAKELDNVLSKQEEHEIEQAMVAREMDKLKKEQLDFLALAEDNRKAVAVDKAHFVTGMSTVAPAPTRASTFPQDAVGRKRTPVGTGVLDYFPDALIAIAQVSHAGNEQHNPGQPLHWARGKSTDESDALIRHFLERGARDTDGMRHSAKMAWRALALLQKEIEESR